MARKKVKLAWIANDAVRRATFKKRRRGLLKKVSELAILCDITACAVVYGPHEARPEVWPSEFEARNILQQFKALPAMEQGRKMVNQEGFLQQRVKKMVEQFQRMEREIRESEIAVLMYEGMVNGDTILDIGMEDANSLICFVDMKLKAVYETINAVKARMMGAEAAMEFLRHDMYPAEINGIDGSSNVGLLLEMMQPYMNAGGQWVDPNLFNF